ncbi:hypothetical protein [Scopulibacillus darangshiensis]|uniref:hypothetical protein n=1 Tax=Scopulibacillus darangshiensis TaxID=442528 RepID=UPI00104EF98F|nr:hypothetical protein [Scopulibacillus darangshiensis]
MRIKDYGFVNQAFIKGYNGFESEMKRVPDIVKSFYQYDTAVMLTLLFYTELNDKRQGELAKDRLLALYKTIKLAL